MFAEGYFNVRQSAQIWGAAQQHQLCFSGVYLETVCSEPDIKRSQNVFHARDDRVNFGFFAADQNLRVVGVLHYHCDNRDIQIVDTYVHIAHCEFQ